MAGVNLKTLYEEAKGKENSYVSSVHSMVPSDSFDGVGVNNLDGTPKQMNIAIGNDGTIMRQKNDAADEFQREFTPNKPGDFRYGGGGKVPGGETPLTRWLSKAYNIAFDGEGPATLPAGYWFTIQKFRQVNRSDPQANLHFYTPSVGNGFREASHLSEFSKSLIVKGATPYGPTAI